MREKIQQFLCAVYTYSYFRHIYHLNPNQETAGQMLVLSHRNGAIDGYVYRSVFQNVRFLLARQLQRNAVLRFLFPGIAVYRPKDKSNSAHQNVSAVRSCVTTIQDNQFRLGLFPEGTSQLGPQPLPYQTGYAKIAGMAAQEKPLTITPCALFYDDPTCMGGQVFIVQGQSVTVTNQMTPSDIHQSVMDKMNHVLISYDNAETQLTAHRGAIMTMLSGKINYADALYQIRENPDILEKVQSYCQNPTVQKCLLYKKTPVFPTHIGMSVWTTLITAPIVIPTFLFNIIPVTVGWMGGKFFADDTNTISLWRTLTGYGTGLLFYLIMLFIAPMTVLIGLPLSIWGFHLYGAFKKHAWSLINHIKCPQGVKLFKEVQDEILSKII